MSSNRLNVPQRLFSCDAARHSQHPRQVLQGLEKPVLWLTNLRLHQAIADIGTRMSELLSLVMMGPPFCSAAGKAAAAMEQAAVDALALLSLGKAYSSSARLSIMHANYCNAGATAAAGTGGAADTPAAAADRAVADADAYLKGKEDLGSAAQLPGVCAFYILPGIWQI